MNADMLRKRRRRYSGGSRSLRGGRSELIISFSVDIHRDADHHGLPFGLSSAKGMSVKLARLNDRHPSCSVRCKPLSL